MSVNEHLPMWQHLPLPIRRWCAPVATSLIRAMERGAHALRMRHLREAVDPLTMRGDWLEEFAQLHAFTRREQEGDDALMARIQKTTILERMKTTQLSIEESIFEATGIRITVRPSLPRVARFDDLEAMVRGDHMLDFSRILEEEEIFENLPPAMRGHGGRVPAHGAFGPKGVLIEVARPYDEVIERQIIQAITDKLPAQTGFELSWARRLTIDWTDTLTLSDGGRACWDGFGEDPFGVSPFGSECERFDVAGFGIDPFGENFGSRKSVPQARPRLSA